MADVIDSSPHKKPRTECLPKARIVVCGAGWWAQGWHLPHLHRNPEAEIVAIIEPNPAPKCIKVDETESKTTDQLHELYGAPIFRSIDELLASEVAKMVDGILISSTHATHAENAIKAMTVGWHIMIEKPMTTDPSEAFQLTKAAASYSKTVMVNNSANFRAQSKRAHDLVHSGQIGQVTHVSCALFSPLGLIFHNPDNVGWVKPTGKMLGNGFAWGQLSHTFAWVYLVTGLTPKSVFCHMSYSEKSGADVYASATIRCTNGATISVQGAGDIVGPCKKVDNKIFGTEGMLLFSGDVAESNAVGDAPSTAEGLILRRYDNKNQAFPGFEFENLEKEGNGPESIQTLIAVCLGRPIFNAANAEVGCKSVVSIEAMYRSAKLGQEVEVMAATSD